MLEAQRGQHAVEHPLGVLLRLSQQGALLGRGLDLLRWPRSRAAGCLLWIVLLVVLLIVLSVLFGGFQKGTQVKGLGPPALAASWVRN